ncbi:MAG: hypothetical protein IH836_09310 [Proteobacteria bacterium]|nr:hypothetical protein [Pseudomonadota bacterium]
MSSIFGWLDTSESDRRKALDIIDLFKQKETVDELGIGGVRDSIAEILSPGTSTIQTRARYFFFIPWIYLDIENSRGDKSKVASRAKKYEIDLIQILSNSSDSDGTIGIQSGASLQRIPSMIYWAGLARLGFRLFSASQDQYHRALKDGRFILRKDDSGDIDVGVGLTGNWNPHIPAKPADYPDNLSLSLTFAEAHFFREQLRIRADDSLLRHLIEFDEDIPDINYPWEHPRIHELPSLLQRWLEQGQFYAELMHGAQLLYNLMLAKALPREEWVEKYYSQIIEWHDFVKDRIVLYQSWDRQTFWSDLRAKNPNLTISVQTFSDSWIDYVTDDLTIDITQNSRCEELIRLRENRLKGNRARLRSRSHLELWKGDAGSAKLTYRWSITKSHAQDFIDGLRCDA